MYKLLVELCVAPNAVLVDHLSAFGDCLHRLWFVAQSKDVGVAKSVHRLKLVFVEYIVVRYVTVVAVGEPCMRAVAPCGIVGFHHVTVDAYFWFVA